MAISWLLFLGVALVLGGVLVGVIAWTALLLFRRDRGDGG